MIKSLGILMFHNSRETPIVRSITIDGTKVPSTQTNFPVMLSGTYSYLATTANGGGVKNNNGYDILFYSDIELKTKLDHQIEKYVSTTGEVVMWIRIPTLNGTCDTTIYMTYGDSRLTSNPSTDIWPTNYKMVYHFGTSDSFSLTDSTSNAANLTQSGTSSVTATTGKLDGAGNWDVNDYLSVANGSGGSNANFGTNDFTISTWVNTSNTALQYFASKRVNNNGHSSFWGLTIQPGGVAAIEVDQDGVGTNYKALVGTVSVADGTWKHLVVTRIGATVYIYVNGSFDISGSGAGTANISNTEPVEIGRYSGKGTTNHFTGNLDEFRIINGTALSADWITAEYNNQNNPSTFYTISNPITRTSEFLYNPLYTDPNLIAYYKLEDVTDSKCSYDLTNFNSTPFNAAKFNNGANQGASNTTKYLGVSSNLGIAGNGNITVCGWVKLNSNVNGYMVFFQHASTTTINRQIQVYYTGPNAPGYKLIIFDGGNQTGYSVNLFDGLWHHVAMTRASGGNSLLYLDGVEVASTSQSTTSYSANAFTIGSNDDGTSKASALFDDVVIFNRTLTPAEIYSIYQGG